MTSELVLDPIELASAITRWLDNRCTTRGDLRVPCVPALLDEYIERISGIFRGFGKELTPLQVVHLRDILAPRLEDGFAKTPHSWVRISWEPDGVGLSYTVTVERSTLVEEYTNWIETRKPPLFGANPDNKVVEVASGLNPPEYYPILEIGAGTGRNAVPLARRGHPIDAVDITPGFVDQIRETIRPEGLPIRPIVGDVLDPEFALVADRYAMVFASQVVATHFRTTDELGRFCRRASEWMKPGGFFLFNAFLAVDGYEPDRFTREIAQHLWSPLFTRNEVAEATKDLPLELVSDESTFDFERANTPDWAWPPTSWFPHWSRGQDLFKFTDPEARAPVELRWLLFRKKTD